MVTVTVARLGYNRVSAYVKSQMLKSFCASMHRMFSYATSKNIRKYGGYGTEHAIRCIPCERCTMH